MEGHKTMNVEMTPEQYAEYKAMRQEMERKRQEEARRRSREQYARMVDEELETAIPELRSLSAQIKAVKDAVFDNFRAVLDLKAEIIGLKEGGQYSHTFTNSDSNLRLTLGVNTVDGYRDTVEDGIAMVKAYIQSLATDDKTQALVGAVLRLLSRDGQGNLKASRVLQLRKMAEESRDERFLEGVRIIEESYHPPPPRRYIRAQWRDEGSGTWHNIPLGMTDVDLEPDPSTTHTGA